MNARFRRAALCGVLLITPVVAGCRGKLILTEQAEARRLAEALHVDFVSASDAANRAVLSNTDDQSAAAAKEARDAAQAAERDLAALRPLIQSLGYADETRILGQFVDRFGEYKALDDEILPLAVENTNLKAQRLAFGDAQEAVDAMTAALERIGGAPHSADDLPHVIEIEALRIQVLQSRHIAEASDEAMSRMEARMRTSEERAREALKRLGGREHGADFAAAAAAFDRFSVANAEIVRLSRRNTNVRSLAATLGRKRVVSAACDSLLRELKAALASHAFTATR